ncbi:hypothetical protein LguiB_028581 [Lonicera macranthoides]
MGSGFSLPCFTPAAGNRSKPDVIFTAADSLDETLGHSFCYVRSSSRFLSPVHSDRFLSPSQSLRFEQEVNSRPAGLPETGFKTISGASVSANTSTPRTVLQLENIYDFATDSDGGDMMKAGTNGTKTFESTASFSSLPLQPVPRGGGDEGAAFFMSGPIERGALSGPLDGASFSAPLSATGIYGKKKRKGIIGIRKIQRSFSSRPWVVPVRSFVGRKDVPADREDNVEESRNDSNNNNVQWALGKAGEDRVHVVVSEEHGWLFVGIYDGFNGPDAPEFLMDNLYKAVYKELEGLFWDCEEVPPHEDLLLPSENALVDSNSNQSNAESVKKVTFQPEEIQIRRRRLWEFLAEDNPEYGLDLSGSERFAFSVDDALSVSNAGSAVSRRSRSLLLSKLKHGLIKHKESRKFFPWRLGLESKEKTELENRVEERTSRNGRKKKVGPVDQELVLRAMSRALEVTELAYLDMTNKVLDQNPELALMGSCLLVVLMRDEDVYVMNVGDSRAIVAQYESQEVGCSTKSKGPGASGLDGIVEDSTNAGERLKMVENEVNPGVKLTALQLSTDHSTSIKEALSRLVFQLNYISGEVRRIKDEHPDDKHCIVNDRVKGRLKVTRAFGAGFLKQPKLNDALLEMFRNEYIGTTPYLSCSPSLRHHKLCPRDQLLVLSSDGLYQYLTNQEVVSHVESFIENFPEGDPAQHLIEELLLRAAKKAGMFPILQFF